MKKSPDDGKLGPIEVCEGLELRPDVVDANGMEEGAVAIGGQGAELVVVEFCADNKADTDGGNKVVQPHGDADARGTPARVPAGVV